MSPPADWVVTALRAEGSPPNLWDGALTPRASERGCVRSQVLEVKSSPVRPRADPSNVLAYLSGEMRTQTRREGRPREDTGRRRPSTRPGESPPEEPALPAPSPVTSSPCPHPSTLSQWNGEGFPNRVLDGVLGLSAGRGVASNCPRAQGGHWAPSPAGREPASSSGSSSAWVPRAATHMGWRAQRSGGSWSPRGGTWKGAEAGRPTPRPSLATRCCRAKRSAPLPRAAASSCPREARRSAEGRDRYGDLCSWWPAGARPSRPSLPSQPRRDPEAGLLVPTLQTTTLRPGGENSLPRSPAAGSAGPMSLHVGARCRFGASPWGR